MKSEKLSTLVFYVNGKEVVEKNADPETTLISYIRLKLRLTGTKLACGEGGCGACTVMISRWIPQTETVKHYAVNSCLLPLVVAHGCHITTVEGVGSTKTKLHPVQERLAKSHGSQCGYCTPGMVMSMYALLRSTPAPHIKDVEAALQGNLCRCTGYRPIIEAFGSFTRKDSSKSTNKFSCGMGDKCCKIAKVEEKTESENNMRNDQKQSSEQDENKQDIIFPPKLKRDSKLGVFNVPLMFRGERSTWYRPVSIDQLLSLKRGNPDLKIVSGNTEIGVEANILGKCHQNLCYVADIQMLNKLHVDESGVTIGASTPLTDVISFLNDVIKNNSSHATQPMKEVRDMLHWFAGSQVRNVASIGGNLVTASPISDLNPIWLACGCSIEVLDCSSSQVKSINIDSDFFSGYRRTKLTKDQLVLNIKLEFAKKAQYVRAYKVSKRKEDDITIVNAAMLVEFDDVTSSKVKRLSVAYGGMSSVTLKPKSLIDSIVGRNWDDPALVDDATKWLQNDLQLPVDVPGGMAAYRETLAASLFVKFHLEIMDCLAKQGVLKSSENKISESCYSSLENKWEEMQSSRTWQEVDEDQPAIDEVGRSRQHESANLQATGEAVYMDDIPKLENELYICLVTSTRAHAKILSVDVSEASKQPGFVDYVDKDDVTGSNLYNMMGDDEVFANGKVTRVGQPIGAIIADNKVHAQRAAKMVKIDYENINPIIVTIEDAIEQDSFFEKYVVKHGNPEEEYEKCDVKIESNVRIAAQEQFYFETQACLVIPKENNEIELYSSAQDLTELQRTTAKVLGVAEHKVCTRVKRLGGGFGGKQTNFLYMSNPACVAAKKLNRPIRGQFDRHEDMLITGTRHPYLAKYKVGAKKTGEIVSLVIDIYSNCGNTYDLSHCVLSRAMFNLDSAYRIPHVLATGHLCKTNISSCTAFRGFGAPQAMMITEDFMDKLAINLNMDQKQIREVNLYNSNEVTYYNFKQTICTAKPCYEEILEKSEYDARRKQVDEYNSNNKYKKRGLALNVMKYGVGYEAPFLNQGGCLVNIYLDGSVLVSHGGIEMGQGLNTKVIQVASKVLGISPDLVYISETNTSVVPNTTATAASTGSDINCAAAKNACEKLNKRLARYKAKGYDWEKMIKEAYQDRVGLSATGFFENGHDWTHDHKTGKVVGTPWNYCSYGASVSEVEVDCLTGEHVILRSDVIIDAGRSLNPAVDIGQIEGAFIQGYGLYCIEEPLHSPTTGNLITRGPGNYKIPAFGDCPRVFNVHLLKNSRNPHAVFKSKAIGEPPLLLANSVFFAIKDAIRSHRAQNGLSRDFILNAPLTVERTRMAFQDKLTFQHVKKAEDEGKRPWSVNA